MENHFFRHRSAAALAVLAAAAMLVGACSPDADGPASPTRVPTTAATTTVATSVPPTEPVRNSPPLIPPSSVASPEPTGAIYVPPETPGPVPCIDCQPTVEPVAPTATAPPRAVDSRGFPLGTTCGPVSCTSPDGVIFGNPDVIPRLGTEDYLCTSPECSPFSIVPGPMLPSTGSMTEMDIN